MVQSQYLRNDEVYKSDDTGGDDGASGGKVRVRDEIITDCNVPMVKRWINVRSALTTL